MTNPVGVNLGPVQETLLIPLLARARETERPHGLLRDRRACEIVRQLDYDFAKWEGGRSLQGAMLRARMFDRYVEDFLAAHPGGTVVEIGCGLDTRFDRVDNGRVFWFDQGRRTGRRGGIAMPAPAQHMTASRSGQLPGDLELR